MHFLRLLGLALERVLEVRDAERHVPRLVLRGQPEDPLLGLVVRDQLAQPEQRLHEALAEDVQHRGHLREVLGLQNLAQSTAAALHQQAAAVGQRALAEHVRVPRLVHHLRHQEQARLVMVSRDARQPLARHVGGDELDLGQRGAELRHRALNVLRQLVGSVSQGMSVADDH